MGVAKPPPASYRVPQRFSIAAVLAFMTAYALLFGALRLMDAPAVLYLFFGSQALVIAIAQMVFGQQARVVSVVAGVVMLPLWIAIFAAFGPRSSWTSFGQALIMCVCSAPAGALLGYCTGALAAGIFLVLDRLNQYLASPADPAATQLDDDSAMDAEIIEPD